MCRITMRMKAMQRGNAIGKDLGGTIAIAWGDVLWMNRNLRFVAETRLIKSRSGHQVKLSVGALVWFFIEKK